MFSRFSGARGRGLRVPWGFANLNNGANGGAACVNGNNSAGNANWNGLSALCGYFFSQCVTESVPKRLKSYNHRNLRRRSPGVREGMTARGLPPWAAVRGW